MKIAWVTDPHLDELKLPGAAAVFAEYVVKETSCDAMLITGDLSEAPLLAGHLKDLERGLDGRPLWFVLGNHDFYDSSMEAVYKEVGSFQGFLPNNAPIELSPGIALVGQCGWYDAMLGDPYTRFVHDDWFRIKEFKGLDKDWQRDQLLKKLREVARKQVALAKSKLLFALQSYDKVVFATHYPPFKNATWHAGKVSNPAWLPWFSSKLMGDMLWEAAVDYPGKEILVLCGHTHGSGVYKALPNLVVYTGPAKYGSPDVAGMLIAYEANFSVV